MAEHLAANWWAVAPRGVISILFGGLLFVWPVAGLSALVLLFGAYALVDGVAAVVAGVSGRARDGGWAASRRSCSAGALTIVWIVGAYALLFGLLLLLLGLRLRGIGARGRAIAA
jgi:uncharacterized membrane protein HdeD (DUF308 family)